MGEQITWHRQDSFLLTFAKLGTRNAAARTIKLSPSLVSWWMDKDYLGFKARFTIALEAWSDYLEEKAFDRIEHPDKGRGSDILLITLLNAYKPERYKPALVINDSSLKETLDALRTIKQKLRDHETKANQAQGLLDAPDAIEEAQDILARRLPPTSQTHDST